MKTIRKWYYKILLKAFDKIYGEYNMEHNGYITKYTCQEVRLWWLDHKIRGKY